MPILSMLCLAAFEVQAAGLTRSIASKTGRILVELSEKPVRGPAFEVLVQDSTGALTPWVPDTVEATYLGVVRDQPDALVAGQIGRKDGKFRGKIYFDRGYTWQIKADSVVGTRGVAPEKEKFSFTASSLAPHRMGKSALGFSLGFDCSFKYVDLNKGSLRDLLENIEQSAIQIQAIYLQDALLVPRLGRIVVRRSKAFCPYDTATSPLNAIRSEWTTRQTDAKDEADALLLPGYGGGLAWVNTAGSTSAFALVGTESDGAFDVVLRHELGHIWGPGDNPYNRTEDATVMSGNADGRFSGPEVEKILDRRDAIRSRLVDLGPYLSSGVPPYAALDLVETPLAGTEVALPVLDNDHDANGDSLFLESFDSVSLRGGVVRRADRDPRILLFQPPARADSLDQFRYRTKDATGRWSTGVVLIRYLQSDARFYEAESAAFQKAAFGVGSTGYTGSGYLTLKGSDTSRVAFAIERPRQGSVRVVFRYAKTASDTVPVALLVDGVLSDTLRFVRTGNDLKAWDTLVATLALGQGSHRIELVAKGKTNLALDRMTLSEGGASSLGWPFGSAGSALGLVVSSGVLRVSGGGLDPREVSLGLFTPSGERIRFVQGVEMPVADLSPGVYLYGLTEKGMLHAGRIWIGR